MQYIIVRKGKLLLPIVYHTMIKEISMVHDACLDNLLIESSGSFRVRWGQKAQGEIEALVVHPLDELELTAQRDAHLLMALLQDCTPLAFMEQP